MRIFWACKSRKNKIVLPLFAIIFIIKCTQRVILNSQRKPKQLYSLAIWHGDILCGMTIGYTSKGPSHVRLDLIEGTPSNNHPLRGSVLQIIVDVSMNYAQMTRKEKLIIANPVPDLIAIYQQRGFIYISEEKSFFGTKEAFCSKEVSYECL